MSNKKVLLNSPIGTELISKSIASHSTKTTIGAHSIFLGQVREDLIADKKVVAIDYSAYAEMAEDTFHSIREATFEKFPITCMHIYHSTGTVKVGEISLFVFTSAPHRMDAIDATTFVVEEIKSKAPVWGKEILEDQSFIWKENT